jgi:hypothetical protein
MNTSTKTRQVALNICTITPTHSAISKIPVHKERVVCISSLIVDCGVVREHTFTGQEDELVQSFWESIRPGDLFLGYNTLEMEVLLLRQKAMAYGLAPIDEFELQRYFSHDFVDVLRLWSNWGGAPRPKLHVESDILGSDRRVVNLAKVARLWSAGDMVALNAFSKSETRFTYAAYQRSTFQ